MAAPDLKKKTSEEDPTVLAIHRRDLDSILARIGGGGGDGPGGGSRGGPVGVTVVDGSTGRTRSGSLDLSTGRVEVRGTRTTTVDESSGASTRGAPGDHTIAVVVDGSGRVVGTAVFNPKTGAFEVSGEETTVVDETSGSSRTTPTGPPGVPTGTEEPTGGRTTPASGTFPPMPVPPSRIRFGEGSDRFTSECLHRALVFRLGGTPITNPVDVAFRVMIKKSRPVGPDVSLAEAQVSTSVGIGIIEPGLLESIELDLIPVSQVPEQYRFWLERELRFNDLDATVVPCTA